MLCVPSPSFFQRALYNQRKQFVTTQRDKAIELVRNPSLDHPSEELQQFSVLLLQTVQPGERRGEWMRYSAYYLAFMHDEVKLLQAINELITWDKDRAMADALDQNLAMGNPVYIGMLCRALMPNTAPPASNAAEASNSLTVAHPDSEQAHPDPEQPLSPKKIRDPNAIVKCGSKRWRFDPYARGQSTPQDSSATNSEPTSSEASSPGTALETTPSQASSGP